MSQENPNFNPFIKPKFAAMERFICSYLIESLSASPLESVLFICKAGLLLNHKETEKLNLDTEAIESICTVAERLESAKNGDGDRHPVHLVSLDWETHLAPWVKCKAYSHWQTGMEPGELKEMGVEEVFHLTSSTLTARGYRGLVSDFLQMATPFAQTLGGMLTQLISPETYTDMLVTYKGVKNA